MKPSELTPCRKCGNGLSSGGPAFYRVTLSQHIINPQAVQRLSGMSTYFGGNERLARVFTGDEELDTKMFENTILLCQPCALETATVVDAWPDETAEQSDA